MSTDSTPTSTLRDSGMIITAATVILFIWGYAFEAFRWAAANLPGTFKPAVALQEQLFLGGIVALFVFSPLGLAAWGVDKATGNHLCNWARRTWSYGLTHQMVLCIVFLCVSIGLVSATSRVADRFGGVATVESVSLRSGQVSPIQKDMYFIGKSGSTYVFVDSFSAHSKRIYLLSEEELGTLVLKYGRRASRKELARRPDS